MTSVRDSHDFCVFQRECVAAAEAGYDTYLVARGESREDQSVHVIGVGDPPSNRFSRMLNFSLKIYRAAQRVDADLYQLHDPELLPYALKLKRRGKTVVFDSHELYSVLLRSKHYLPFPHQIAWLYRLYERRVLRGIDAVIFVSTIEGKNPFNGVARKTVFVENYPSLYELYQRYDPSVKREQSMCFVGTMTPDRGIENMVEAAQLSHIPLTLVGDIEPASYREMISQMPGAKFVDFKGRMDREAVCEIYQRAGLGLCVMPNGGQYNLSDTFNMKVYDYMSMGLPVVLSDSSYARHVLRRYPFGILVDPADVRQIAEAAEYLLHNPEEAARMGQAGRLAIGMEFNWESQVKKLLKLYEDLIGSSRD